MPDLAHTTTYDKHMICQCRLCKKYSVVSVHQADFDDWQSSRKFVQDAFPYLSNGDREILISNTCNNCWQDMFGSMEDEDEDEGEE
jgi:hypothetical protein